MKASLRIVRLHLACLALLPALAAARDGIGSAPDSLIRPGDRIRVAESTVPGQPGGRTSEVGRLRPPAPPRVLVGRFERMSADTLVIQPDSGQVSVPVPVSSIERLEIWKAGNHVATGATLGLVGGIVVGAIVGSGMDDSESPEECVPEPGHWFCDDFIEPSLSKGVEYALLVGLLGACVGACVGSLVQTTRWQPIDLRGLKAGITLTGRGHVQLACSIRLQASRDRS